MGILCKLFLSKDHVSHFGHSLWTISVKGPCVTLWEAFGSDLGLRTLCYIMGSICERFGSNNPVLHLHYGPFLWNSVCVKGPCGSVVHCFFLVSVPGLSPWGSPNAWWDGSVHDHFPTHVPTAVHVSQRYLPFWQLHSNLWISVMELVMSWRQQ